MLSATVCVQRTNGEHLMIVDFTKLDKFASVTVYLDIDGYLRAEGLEINEANRDEVMNQIKAKRRAAGLPDGSESVYRHKAGEDPNAARG